MNNSEVREKINDLVKRYSNSDKEVKPDFDILLDTGLDSVSVMDIVMELEDDLDIMIPIEKLSDVRTIGDFEAVIGTVIKNRSRSE